MIRVFFFCHFFLLLRNCVVFVCCDFCYNVFMKIVNKCCVNFNGQFIEPKNLSKKAYKAKNMLDEVLHTKIKNKSNNELIKNLPFDVFIYCKNPTKRLLIHNYLFI